MDQLQPDLYFLLPLLPFFALQGTLTKHTLAKNDLLHFRVGSVPRLFFLL